VKGGTYLVTRRAYGGGVWVGLDNKKWGGGAHRRCPLPVLTLFAVPFPSPHRRVVLVVVVVAAVVVGAVDGVVGGDGVVVMVWWWVVVYGDGGGGCWSCGCG